MDKDTKKKIFDFFKDNPKPNDSAIHALSDNLKIDTHEFEGFIYELLGSFLGAGKSKDFKGNYDPKELEMGIKVEMEHTGDEDLAEKIAKDHLSEFKDYYTRLATMEKKAEKESKNEAYKRYVSIFETDKQLKLFVDKKTRRGYY